MYQLYIVDDDPIILQGLTRTINWAALGVAPPICAHHGKMALEKMEELPPDIVITDANMPQMDGLALIEEIRKRLPQLNCGSCGSPTCLALAEDIVEGYAHEMDCLFLLKDKVRQMAQQMIELSDERP